MFDVSFDIRLFSVLSSMKASQLLTELFWAKSDKSNIGR